MSMEEKQVEALKISDLQRHPVWEFVNDDGGRETVVRPVTVTPAANLKNRVVGTQVRLACGRSVWALIGNVDTRNARSTEHFLTLSVEEGSRWFHLARYHDFDYRERGPAALAEFLKLRTDEVFPIRYDITPWSTGDAHALSGTIFSEPREKLTRSEIIALAVG
jgi:hypothetical protein